MPELPDITVYLESLERRIVGERLLSVRVASPFLVRNSIRHCRPSKAKSAGLRAVGKAHCHRL